MGEELLPRAQRDAESPISGSSEIPPLETYQHHAVVTLGRGDCFAENVDPGLE